MDLALLCTYLKLNGNLKVGINIAVNYSDTLYSHYFWKIALVIKNRIIFLSKTSFVDIFLIHIITRNYNPTNIKNVKVLMFGCVLLNHEITAERIQMRY